MAPAILLHGEKSNFSKSGVPKKHSFYLHSRNNDDNGAYPDFKSIRTNDPPGAGVHSGIPAERDNFGSGNVWRGQVQRGQVQRGHFQNGYFQSSRLDSRLENRLNSFLDRCQDHFSRARQERKKSTDGEHGQPSSSNLPKWQSRR
ncbi:hypothetical protein C922_04541 [Plasmodium inui San Antonio 1]|uniref:Uncharacterized protein n=1 Tax=Plasmodium inui San Antonio 1 TaxID=1237626 RepID=W7A0F7_9APIC|nr:hypothetical protein C922_04541 [Plasmodium inui San Antonio 1]EUD65030.1 hypothetical protein C922_04541 [Plasmodium inui San Antonio 1]